MKTLIIAALVATSPLMANAELFRFYAITSNDPSNPAIGESQLLMDVTETGAGQVSVLFTNTGPEQSAISDIYFDTPDVAPPFNLAIAQIINGSGVQFIEGARPQNLPAGMDPLIAFCSDEDLGATSPPPKNGINPYESLLLELTYTDTYSFIDLLGSGELRVGLHVISMGTSADSESFINVIPEPGTASMLAAGSAFLISFRRRMSGLKILHLDWQVLHPNKEKKDLELKNI